MMASLCVCVFGLFVVACWGGVFMLKTALCCVDVALFCVLLCIVCFDALLLVVLLLLCIILSLFRKLFFLCVCLFVLFAIARWFQGVFFMVCVVLVPLDLLIVFFVILLCYLIHGCYRCLVVGV